MSVAKVLFSVEVSEMDRESLVDLIRQGPVAVPFKWTVAIVGILFALVSAADNAPGLGAAAAGLFVSATLLHLYDRWRCDVGMSGRNESDADPD